MLADSSFEKYMVLRVLQRPLLATLSLFSAFANGLTYLTAQMASGFHLWNAESPEKVPDIVLELRLLLECRHVAALLVDHKLTALNASRQLLVQLYGADPVVSTRIHEHRNLDLSQPISNIEARETIALSSIDRLMELDDLDQQTPRNIKAKEVHTGTRAPSSAVLTSTSASPFKCSGTP